MPDPLKIKIIFTDKEGKVSTIVTEHVNSQLALKNADWAEKDQERPVRMWIDADNLETESRVFVAVFEEDTEKWGKQVHVKTSESNKNFYQNDMQQIIFKAKTEAKGKNEGPSSSSSASTDPNTVLVPLDGLCASSEEKGFSIDVSALVDIENNFAYALKCDLKTSTSSTTAYYPLPDFI